MNETTLRYYIESSFQLKFRVHRGQVQAKIPGLYHVWHSLGSVQLLSLLPDTRPGEAHVRGLCRELGVAPCVP